jgi:hypothetical protein
MATNQWVPMRFYSYLSSGFEPQEQNLSGHLLLSVLSNKNKYFNAIIFKMEIDAKSPC